MSVYECGCVYEHGCVDERGCVYVFVCTYTYIYMYIVLHVCKPSQPNPSQTRPGLVPACAMHAALQAYQQATALEALTAVLLLRVQQGPAKPAQIEASPPVSGGKHKGGPVMSLAKGTQALRVFLEGGEEEEGSALSTRWDGWGRCTIFLWYYMQSPHTKAHS